LVFAARIAEELARSLPPAGEPAIDERDAGLLPSSALVGVQAAMTAGAGVLRNADSLSAAATALARIGADRAGDVEPCVEAWEATNLHTVANALVAGARLRAETRGCHWREDYPETSPEWRGHLVTSLLDGGVPETVFEAAPVVALTP
jgi:succinate dehydrogenase/fumarate reductase flavoprotein subunit